MYDKHLTVYGGVRLLFKFKLIPQGSIIFFMWFTSTYENCILLADDSHEISYLIFAKD